MKKLVKLVTCLMCALVVGLMLMGNADAKQKQKQKDPVWNLGYVVPDGSGDFRIEDSFTTKEECLKEFNDPVTREYLNDKVKELYPGKMTQIGCRPEYF